MHRASGPQEKAHEYVESGEALSFDRQPGHPSPSPRSARAGTRPAARADGRTADRWLPTVDGRAMRVALDTIVADSLKPAAIGFCVLYVFFAVSHLLVLPRAGGIMASAATSSALTYLVLAMVLHRRPVPAGWAHPIAAGIAAIVLFNSLLHLYLIRDPYQTTNLILLVIGVGCFFLSVPWATLLYLATFAGWGVLAREARSPEWMHFGFALVSATALSAIAHAARLRMYRRLEGLRLQNEAWQAELEAVLAASPLATFAMDGEGRVRFWNAAAERLLGWHSAEVLGSVPPIPLEQEGISTPLVARLCGGAPVANAEGRCRARGGEWIEVSVSAAPLFDAWGVANGVVAVVADITGRKRAEEDQRRLIAEQVARGEAEEERRRLEQFTAMLGHELRNPLGVVGNVVQALRRRPDDASARRRAVEILDRQVRHQTRLVDDLLDVSRISYGKIELRLEPLDLVALVATVVDDHRAEMEAARLTPIVDLPHDRELRVVADPARLAQIFGNLLSNAVKFTEPGGRVIVQISAGNGDPAFAEVSIADTGAGIAPEMLPQIFEPFAQADQSRGGLGLGLALVKNLVELHGGAVDARSDGLGQGAKFLVRLPVAAAAVPTPARPPATPVPPTVSRHILLVEDNEEAAETLGDLLCDCGHRVEIATSGRDGLAAAQRYRPDVILCDLGLPDMDGYTLARELRSLPGTASICLIAISGYTRPEDHRRSRDAGFDCHLAKPLDFPALQRLLADEDTPVGA